jgi:hypothetical protein
MFMNNTFSQFLQKQFVFQFKTVEPSVAKTTIQGIEYCVEKIRILFSSCYILQDGTVTYREKSF